MRRISEYQKKHTTSHDGLRLYYEVAGNSKNVLFFLHGMGGDVAAWDEIRTFFHHLGYTTIAMDLRGHGFSDHPKNREGYGFTHFAQDIEAVLREEKIKNFVLIGHCFGGMVTYAYEFLFPKTAKALVLISVSYRAPYFSYQSIGRRMLQTLIRSIVSFSSNAYIPRHADYSTGGFEHDFEPWGLFRVIRHNSLKAYLSLTDEVFSLNVMDQFSMITTPTLLITGTKDTIYPSRMSEKVHQKIKASKLVHIEGGNHPIVLNNPMEVAVTMQKYFQKNNFL